MAPVRVQSIAEGAAEQIIVVPLYRSEGLVMREPAEERRRQGGREPLGADQRRRRALAPSEVSSGSEV